MMPNYEPNREALRSYVRGMYDLQKLRIAIGNRLVQNFRVRHGQEPGTKADDTLDDEGVNVVELIRTAYKRICDGLIDQPRAKRMTKNQLATMEPTKEYFDGFEDKPFEHAKQQHTIKGVISTWTEVLLVQQWIIFEAQESHMSRKLEAEIEHYPIWIEFMRDIRGLGPMMAAVILTELNPHKARHISSFWKYCGLDVYRSSEDGYYYGRCRRADALVERQYVNKDGDEATRVGITFNPWLKTKLMGVLGSNFIKLKSEYSAIYYAEKARLEADAVYGAHNDGKMVRGDGLYISKKMRHGMAMRKMMKQFLADLWLKWRELEGLPMSVPYAEAKLGLAHGEDRSAATPFVRPPIKAVEKKKRKSA